MKGFYSKIFILFFFGLSVLSPLRSVAQTVVFYQNFDGTYTTVNGATSISIAGSACIPQAQTWTGSESGTDGYFYRDDQTMGGGSDICGGTYQAPGCTEAGSYCLYFDGFDAASGTTGTIISPAINLAAYSSNTVTLTFYYFNEDETSVQVLFSNNGGSTFTSQATLSSTSANWQSSTLTIPAAYCVSNFELEFVAKSKFEYYPIAIDEVSISYTNSTNATYSYSASVQTFTVPACVTTLTVTAVGAAGGAGGATGSQVAGGNGASITGTVTVAGGDVIDIVTGGAGEWDNVGHYGGGGGGGTYVWDNTTSTLLVVAGGGGGTSYGGYAGSAAGTTTNGAGGTAGGTSSNASKDNGAGGAGWTSNGTNGQISGSGIYGGADKANGFGGGLGYGGAGDLVNGGYGGGGGGGYDDGAGGGGYGGGAGGSGNGLSAAGGGGGGSSYVNGTAGATSATNTGNGSATIAYKTSGPTASISAQGNVTCNGTSTGYATAAVTSGTGPYTYSWTPTGHTGATTPTYSALPAGSYTCTVTDANGCTSTATVTITQSAAVTASISSSTNVTSIGGTTGSATAAGGGGTSPYTYSWTPTGYTGATTATYSALPAGTYTCTVTDANGCTATTTVNIGVTLTFNYSASIQSVTLPACISTLTITAVGGAGGAGNTGGSKVLGGNGASITGTVTVTGGDVLDIVTGGTGGWDNTGSYGGGGGGGTYVWDNTASILYVVAGGGGGTSYSGTAGSAAGTTTNGAGGTAGGTANNGSKDNGAGGAGWTANGANGAISGSGMYGGADKANGFGGGAGYVASVNGAWGGGGGGAYDDGAGGGGYGGGAGGTGTGGAGGGGGGGSSYVNGTAGATSATNTGNGSVTVTFNTSAPTATLSAQTNNTCTLTAGRVTATGSGGTPGYTYAWTPTTGVTGPNTASPTTMASGTYTCTITDSKGCQGTVTTTITGPTILLAASATSTNISCFGGTGSVSVSATNGTPTYTYSWNSAPVQTTATASGLAAGSYTCTVHDADGCSTTASATITGPAAALSASVTAHTMASGCFTNGSITIAAAGGTSPYSYSWAPVGYTGGTTTTYSGLIPGSYTCTVTDANNCTTTVNYTITGGVPLTASISSSTNPSGCGTTDGSATGTGVNGTAPYTYSWSPTTGVTGPLTASPSTMAAGTYTCTVTDHNGCIATATVVLTAPTGTNDNFNCATPIAIQATNAPTFTSGTNNAATLEANENVDCQGFGSQPSISTTVWYSFSVTAATGTGPFFINMNDQSGATSGGVREYYHGLSVWSTPTRPASGCASCTCAPMTCMDNEEVGYNNFLAQNNCGSNNSVQQVQPAFTKYSVAVNNLPNGTYYIQVGYPEAGDGDAFQISVSTGLPATYTLTNPLPATGKGQVSAAATSYSVKTGYPVSASAIENPVAIPYVLLTGNSCSSGGDINSCTACPGGNNNLSSSCIPCFGALATGINFSSSSATYPAGFYPAGGSNIGSSGTTYQSTATAEGMGTIQGGVIGSGYVTQYCYSFSTNSTSTEVTANLQAYATYLLYGNGSAGPSNCTWYGTGGRNASPYTVYWGDWALYGGTMNGIYGCGNINNFAVSGLGCNTNYVLCMMTQTLVGEFIARDNTQAYDIYPWVGQDRCNPTTNLCTSVLPITLTSFQVEYEEATGTVVIYWSVASQINNKLFTVEKSANGIDWTTVMTTPGAGTTNEFMFYSGDDESPYAGISYYRLKQTDFDGTNFYSSMQPINIPGKYSVNIFPNPTAGDMTLRYSTQSPDPVSITITDISGKIIQAYTINEVQEGVNDYQIATATLAQGMYLIKISNAQKTFYQKFIKQ